jgi:hypothetical protein
VLAVDQDSRRQLDRRPILPQAGDQRPVEGEQGDLPHPLANLLGGVIEGGLPLGDRRPEVVRLLIGRALRGPDAAESIRAKLDELG